MKTTNYFPVQQLCASYEVELAFFVHLSEIGLVEIITVEQTEYIHQEKLTDI